MKKLKNNDFIMLRSLTIKNYFEYAPVWWKKKKNRWYYNDNVEKKRNSDKCLSEISGFKFCY